MNKLIMNVFVLGLTFVSHFAQAGALCPPTSCNPYNGCMDGCSNYSATGTATCNENDSKTAE